jgi:hypothetical protein
MTELIVDHAGRRYRLRLDAGDLVMVRLDADGPTSVGRMTVEAAEVLAALGPGQSDDR